MTPRWRWPSLVARYGGIVLLLATAALGGFTAGRATAPDPEAACAVRATYAGGQRVETRIC